MEFLAFVQNAASYEDPTPDPELTLEIKIPGSTGVALAGVALAVAAVSASPSKAVAATSAIAQGSLEQQSPMYKKHWELRQMDNLDLRPKPQ
ncbi:hypothetical protein [Leptodesmis sp.]|uniref:hypothetical protein n=1 Tax=Leptodesmis sp. TaxID=3100501 RepID=UPI004053460C